MNLLLAKGNPKRKKRIKRKARRKKNARRKKRLHRKKKVIRKNSRKGVVKMKKRKRRRTRKKAKKNPANPKRRKRGKRKRTSSRKRRRRNPGQAVSFPALAKGKIFKAIDPLLLTGTTLTGVAGFASLPNIASWVTQFVPQYSTWQPVGKLAFNTGIGLASSTAIYVALTMLPIKKTKGQVLMYSGAFAIGTLINAAFQFLSDPTVNLVKFLTIPAAPAAATSALVNRKARTDAYRGVSRGVSAVAPVFSRVRNRMEV